MTDDPRLTPADGDLHADLVDRVAATLRSAASLCECDADREYLSRAADDVARNWDDACCPICQEVVCDNGCPLEGVRATNIRPVTDGELYDRIDRAVSGWANDYSNEITRAVLTELAPDLAEAERLRAELADVQRGADTWKDAADGWEERAERLTAERDEQRQRAEQAEATIRHFAAEAHHRKWQHQSDPPAFDDMHRLGNELLAASSAPESTATPRHIGGGANAEDCPACSGTNLPYPFICPGDAPESPTDAPTAPTRPDDTHQPHNGPQENA